MIKFRDQDATFEVGQTTSNVGILFVNEDIAQIFSDLLTSRGVTTSRIQDPSLVNQFIQVITEPCYLEYLSEEQLAHSILVASSESDSPTTIHQLTRPLTEEKIEMALKHLLEVLSLR